MDMNDLRENLRAAVDALIGEGKKFSSGRELAQRAHTLGLVESADSFSRTVNRVRSDEKDVQLSTVDIIARTAGKSAADLLAGPKRKEASSAHPMEWLENAPTQLSLLARSLIVEIIKADQSGLPAERANALLTIIRPILENSGHQPKPLVGADDPYRE
ncbi:hypothetical protein [Burkholderia multivorans]|uniref:hypothetical protein n=2 Tax=Burkholderia multivorans TaxID=87883 RepID=UPI001C25C9C7|nr:hypothetical protein [Burkholderia multivorans]